MFGKIENGALVLAPKVIKLDDMVCYNPTDEILCEAGYLPVVNTPRPDGNYVESWEEKDGKIVCVWVESDVATPCGMTAEERLCQAESELAALKRENDQLCAEVMYLCMMNDVEPMEVSK